MTRFKYFFLAVLLFAAPACAQEGATPAKPFAQWLDDFKQEARSEGITQDTLDDALADTEPSARVLELDQKQPESTLTLDEYLDNVATDKRVSDGQRFYAENRSLLKKVGAEYGVQPRFIVALWGIETNYGRNTGGFSTINSLATLAYDGRRSQFFRDELINALKILQSEQMPASEMKGSWAGALGQCQFMPSTFQKYAVDFDRDGKRDIWHTNADVFASIANYLKSLGWDDTLGWGRPVRLPAGFDVALTDIKKERTVEEWNRLGVRTEDGKRLPGASASASVIMIGKDEDAVPYIVYSNFKSLLQWNRSRFFATGVGTLADRVGK